MAMAGEPQSAAGFEKNLEELEAVVKQLEGGDLTLDQSLALFERGVELSDSCKKQLDAAETRVEILTKRGNQVRPEPFKPE
jgi:exodeoxyribonuclease VII small subunit